MIERVVGCFGRGGKGLVRPPKKLFRTRRFLHHAFWSHGAGNIDLPPWWKFLLQAHEPISSLSPDRREISVTGSVAAGLHELFLGLLYPAQTHVLIQRLNRATKSHRQAAQLAKKGSREYTSIAEDLLAGEAETRNGVQNAEGAEKGNTILRDHSNVSNKIAEELMSKLDHPEQYDQLWKLQQDSFETANPLEARILKEIFFLLSASERKIDLERSLALFETFDVKTSVLCKRAVKAALGLADLATAVDIHFQAATINPGSTDIGTPYILSYAILHEQWKVAIDTWYRLWQSKLLYYSSQRDLWKEVDNIPLQQLLIKTEEAADFALDMIDAASSSNGTGPSSEAVNAARDFAFSMAERAFEVRGVPFIPKQYLKLLNKLIAFGNSNIKIRMQALGQLLSLKDREFFPRALARNEKAFFLAAIEIYRELRQDPDFVPPKNLLEELFTGLVIEKSYSGMLMILEDWQRFVPTKMPIPFYIRMARVVGGSGQVAAMDRVFNSFIQDYSSEDVSETVRAKIMNYSLWVHFKRAETKPILEKFDILRNQHGFIPTTASYNLVIMTFARVGDVEGAMSWFQSLKDSGLVPNRYTFSNLMSMYAKRGDLDAVQDIWQEVEHNGMKPDISMIDALVVANVRDERFKEAEHLVEKATTMDLEGSRTHMWNVLLNAYALRQDLDKVSEVHTRMHSIGVAEDSSTYAALLLSLCLTGNVHSTMRIFKHVMPGLGISRTAMHYAIIMAGFMKGKNYDMVFSLYQDMLKKKLVPDTSVHNTLLRAAAARDEQHSKAQNAAEKDYKRARDVLDIALQSLNPAELASVGTRAYFGTTPADQALIASYYSYMIHLYGLQASFTKVSELYDEFIATAKQAGKENIIDDPPALMLTALLTAHNAAGNDEEVDRCWYLALDKYEKLAKRSNASPAKPGWVLHARRFIINPILGEYMKHLNDRGRHDDMINVIKDLRWAGYDLHSHRWNQYVSYLVCSNTTKHCYLAFEICENELMQNWPGWERLASCGADRTRGSWFHMKLVMDRENRGSPLLPFKRMVQYKTLVQLASVYSDAQSGSEVAADHVSRYQLETLAPVTADAVKRMPRLMDAAQLDYLSRPF